MVERVLSKDEVPGSMPTVCVVFIPNVVMAKRLAHVSITHDNNNFFWFFVPVFFIWK